MSSQSEELLHSVQGLPRQEREKLLSGKESSSQFLHAGIWSLSSGLAFRLIEYPVSRVPISY